MMASLSSWSRFASLLIFCLVRSDDDVFLFDRLSPYEEGYHGGSTRSRRELEIEQSVDWNRTYEEYHLAQLEVPESSALRYKLHRYEDTVRSQVENSLSVHRIRYLLGSLVHIYNPYYTLSVLEPSRPGGCKVNYFNTIRSTVRDTANNRGCKVAVNAGYFSVPDGKCLGNVVSDGRIVQTSAELNANFGIRQDGTIVVGYVPEEDVADGSFRQLVSGVIWLVRNGTNYVNESMQLESSSNQNTGKMATFVNVLSARTAVGHDSNGRIIVANVEGQTHRRGANLYEFADLLIAHGVINAINLDGGGSSTLVHDHSLINYPSDHCFGDPAYRCERKVSTILCFHDVECIEPSCNNHGLCIRGECVCQLPWVGIDCGHLNCSLEACSDRGNCTDGKCVCESGWGGLQCQEACSPGFYGPGCKSKCWCYGKSLCDPATGECICPPGYTGFGCWKECTEGFFGPGCLLRCPAHNCSGRGKCSVEDGSCVCNSNWMGTACNESVLTSFVQAAASSILPTLPQLPSASPDCEGEDMCSSTMIPAASPVSGCDQLLTEQGSHCDTGALAILVLCIFLATSVILHIFFCLRLKVDSQPGRKQPQRFHIVMQESSSDFD